MRANETQGKECFKTTECGPQEAIYKHTSQQGKCYKCDDYTKAFDGHTICKHDCNSKR